MDADDTRDQLEQPLDQAVREGVPERVVFPEALGFPEESYSSTGHPRIIVPLDDAMPVRARVGGVDSTVVYRRGDLLAIAPHGWTIPIWDRRHRFYSIVFYPTYVRYVRGECDGSGTAPPPTFHHTRRPLDPPAHHVLEALDALPRYRRVDGDAVALARLLLRFALEHLHCDDVVSDAAGKARRTYELACDYVNRNVHRPIDRSSAARGIGITESHLSRLFQEHGGTSFARYLLRLRMERAAALLANPLMSVKVVAYHCGYRDDSHFIRAFRSYHGASPGKWRP